MSLREWLILLGAIIVIGIILDGVRRMHRARKDSLEISRGMGADQIEESPLDEYNPELPSGGARIIDRLGVSASERAAAEDRPLETHWQGEDTAEERMSAGDLDDELPESFSLHAEDSASAETMTANVNPAAKSTADESASDEIELTDPDRDPMLSAPRSLHRPVRKPEKKPARRSVRDRQPAVARPDPKGGAPRPATGNRPLAGANRPPAKEVFVINVDSRDPEGFKGADLKRLLEACGLEHGDMGIYHRHENDDTHTPVQFSVANAVEPGTFAPSSMASMSTPAISFFMSLPGPNDSLQAYDFMIETAQCVVRNLGGDLKDERRSVMTAQTIEHGRQRVREFERKRRSARV